VLSNPLLPFTPSPSNSFSASSWFPFSPYSPV
jgi:hypothetical protein